MHIMQMTFEMANYTSSIENTFGEIASEPFFEGLCTNEELFLATELKVKIQDFFPLPTRAKEFQKLDNKIVLLGKDLKETSGLKTSMKTSVRVFQLFSKVQGSPITSSQLLFFPKETLAKPSLGLLLNNKSIKESSKPLVQNSSLLAPKQSSLANDQINRPFIPSHSLSTSSKQNIFEHKEKSNDQAVSSSLFEKSAPKEPLNTTYQRREEKKEREGREKHSHQDSDEEFEDSSKKEKKKGIGAVTGINASTIEKNSHSASNSSANGVRKPILEPPKLGVFALYHLLDKMGLTSESASYYQYKQEIEANQAERNETHQLMLSELEKSLAKEKQSARWGTALKVFSWIGSITSIISGVALIFTGVGAVAGALLIAGGVISIASQIMEMTGGWQKIVEILPGDDLEKKRAIVTWMQIGIAVLCLILAGAGIVFGGYAAFGEASQKAMNMIGAVATAAGGVCSIGKGIEEFLYKNKIADAKKYECRLSELKHSRENLMEMIDESPDRLLSYYESLSRNLGFLEEIDRAFQRAWR